MNKRNLLKMNVRLVLFVMIAVTAILVTSCGSTASTTTAASGTTTAATTKAVSTGAATTATTAAPGQTTTAVAGISKKITAEEGKALLDKTPDAILLDVRTVEEYKELRIPGSVLIPVSELPNRLSELPKDPAKPIVIYCRSGNRSATAADILIEAGFPVVYDMGGINNWSFETEKG